MQKTLYRSVILAVASVTVSGTVFAQLTVVPPPTPPVPVRQIQPQTFPPYIPLRTPKVRCEQDRLLTDASPCGAETVQPIVIVPKKLKRCEQDRMVNDNSPCGNGTEAK